MDVLWPRGLRWRAKIFHMVRRIGCREQYYTNTRDISVSWKIAGNIKVKLYVCFRWFIIDIYGLTNSFCLSSFVNLDMISLLPWIAAGSSRKSIWERLNGFKVRAIHGNLTDFMFRGSWGRQNGCFRCQGSALTRKVEFHTARRICFREQYYTGT